MLAKSIVKLIYLGINSIKQTVFQGNELSLPKVMLAEKSCKCITNLIHLEQACQTREVM